VYRLASTNFDLAPPATNGGTTDKERPVLARKVVVLRDKDRLSWLKMEAKLELAPEAESAKAGASRARTLYRLGKGEDADPGRFGSNDHNRNGCSYSERPLTLREAG
jgi:hypothetical protein